MKIINLQNLPLQSVSHNREIKKKVLLSMGDLPHLTNFSQAFFAPGQVATAHAHQDMCEVFLVTAGEGKMQVGDRELTLTPGVCVVVEIGEIHEIINTGSQELSLIYFGIQV